MQIDLSDGPSMYYTSDDPRRIREFGRVPGSPVAPQMKKTVKAKFYDYLYRPNEDKYVTQKKQKKRVVEVTKGFEGSPKNSSERYVNKIFDGRRLKTKN